MGYCGGCGGGWYLPWQCIGCVLVVLLPPLLNKSVRLHFSLLSTCGPFYTLHKGLLRLLTLAVCFFFLFYEFTKTNLYSRYLKFLYRLRSRKIILKLGYNPKLQSESKVYYIRRSTLINTERIRPTSAKEYVLCQL